MVSEPQKRGISDAEGEPLRLKAPPKRLTKSQLRVLATLAKGRPIYTAGAFGDVIAADPVYLKRFARPVTVHVLQRRGWITPGKHWGSWEITDSGRRRLDRWREASIRRAVGKGADGGSVQ